MATVDLYECDRCGLEWVPKTEMVPGRCPACRIEHSIPQGPIYIGRRDVKVDVVRMYGLRSGLLDERVRRGMDDLWIGWCPHGFISSHICNDCKAGMVRPACPVD